jgi:aminopeptidase
MTPPAPPADPRLAALARLAVRVGANVQPGQIVSVSGRPGQEELARAVAVEAYRRGARFVDLAWFDPYVKLARLELAAEESLDFVPPWYAQRMIGLGDARAATIALAGPTTPGLYDAVDPARAGRDRLPSVREGIEIVMAAKVNWTVVPCPNPAWASLVFPDLDPADALERLWTEVAHVCRLDEEDPGAAWRARGAEPPRRDGSTRAASARCASAGPGPTSPWASCRDRDGWGAPTAAWTASSTCPTSRPRRCSPPRIPPSRRAS